MGGEPSVSLQFVSAPADGIGPALLLTVRQGKSYSTPAQAGAAQPPSSVPWSRRANGVHAWSRPAARGAAVPP